MPGSDDSTSVFPQKPKSPFFPGIRTLHGFWPRFQLVSPNARTVSNSILTLPTDAQATSRLAGVCSLHCARAAVAGFEV